MQKVAEAVGADKIAQEQSSMGEATVLVKIN